MPYFDPRARARAVNERAVRPGPGAFSRSRHAAQRQRAEAASIQNTSSKAASRAALLTGFCQRVAVRGNSPFQQDAAQADAGGAPEHSQEIDGAGTRGIRFLSQPAHRPELQRRQDEPQPDPSQDGPRDQSQSGAQAEVVISANDAASNASPMLTRSGRAPVRQPADAGDGDGEHDARRQQDGAHVRRRKPQAELHVHRQQVGRTEQRRAVDECHDAAHGETAVAEQREVHQRFAAGRWTRRCHARNATKEMPPPPAGRSARSGGRRAVPPARSAGTRCPRCPAPARASPACCRAGPRRRPAR